MHFSLSGNSVKHRQHIAMPLTLVWDAWLFWPLVRHNPSVIIVLVIEVCKFIAVSHCLLSQKSRNSLRWKGALTQFCQSSQLFYRIQSPLLTVNHCLITYFSHQNLFVIFGSHQSLLILLGRLVVVEQLLWPNGNWNFKPSGIKIYFQ